MAKTIRMRKKLIAHKHFEGVIDITDPCYDKDVFCRMTATVKAGEYACRIWRSSEEYVMDGNVHQDIRVGIIGIYLDDFIPLQKEMEEIGIIGVDAGMAGFFMNKPDYNVEQWDDICHQTCGSKKMAWTRPEGFFSDSGYGDGSYPVYAYKNEKNEITALEIRFL